MTRHLKRLGRGRRGSLPLPPRDIYLANKANGAAPSNRWQLATLAFAGEVRP
jgi:hypothetical protein